MKIIDDQLVNDLAEEAKKSPRLRKNYNFHQSLDYKCHRFLNALEPGTQVPVHHHPTKDETFVILKGKVKVLIYNDQGEVVESCVLSHEEGRYGLTFPRMCGIVLSVQSPVCCWNARRDLLSSMKWMGFLRSTNEAPARKPPLKITGVPLNLGKDKDVPSKQCDKSLSSVFIFIRSRILTECLIAITRIGL